MSTPARYEIREKNQNSIKKTAQLARFQAGTGSGLHIIMHQEGTAHAPPGLRVPSWELSLLFPDRLDPHGIFNLRISLSSLPFLYRGVLILQPLLH
jgi:hypothetical protein